jgi:hypothetical protein
VADAHRALVEQVVEVDAAFVERYLNEGDVDPRELHAPLEQALREGHLIPVCFCSARSGAGVAELLDALERLMPNPAEGNPPPFLEGSRPRPAPTPQDPTPRPMCWPMCSRSCPTPTWASWACCACTRAPAARHVAVRGPCAQAHRWATC